MSPRKTAQTDLGLVSKLTLQAQDSTAFYRITFVLSSFMPSISGSARNAFATVSVTFLLCYYYYYYYYYYSYYLGCKLIFFLRTSEAVDLKG